MARAKNKLNLMGATSMAVGTMVGASIFSVFGLGARIAGHNLPLVFVVSGMLAFPLKGNNPAPHQCAFGTR